MMISLFQLTASRGGWRKKDIDNYVSQKDFNSQPHEEADILALVEMIFRMNFNSQPHEEADGFSCIVRGNEYISTHSLTRRLTCGCISEKAWSCEFQLTASRGGWRWYIILDGCNHVISTHSLTRRLTQLESAKAYANTISTHSLTRRLTVADAKILICSRISTHSLTRRLTAILNKNYFI